MARQTPVQPQADRIVIYSFKASLPRREKHAVMYHPFL
jgi:hypothetical protein